MLYLVASVRKGLEDVFMFYTEVENPFKSFTFRTFFPKIRDMWAGPLTFELLHQVVFGLLG